MSKWVLDVDDEKNVDLREREEEERKKNEEKNEKYFNENYEKYVMLFAHLGKEKSKQLVFTLMDKVMMFGRQYRNPKRLHLMKQLKDMKEPYKKVFGEYFIQ